MTSIKLGGMLFAIGLVGIAVWAVVGPIVEFLK
jgi:low affinity Fe/Cu permease